MRIRRQRSFDLPDSAVTPEAIVLSRRRALGTIAGAAVAAAGAALPGLARAAEEVDPSRHLYPAPTNPDYSNAERALTAEADATSYINFFEFSEPRFVNPLRWWTDIRPWEIRIEGLVAKPFTIGIDDLLARVTLEERIYRFRCVEAWAMTVPWTGFALRDLVALADPLGSARYVRFETFYNKRWAPFQRIPLIPWPYVEGLTMDEAVNELAFVATGMYGKPLLRQNGTPIRLVLPWKYGFKSIKSIVRISFTEERPTSFWEELEGESYGFWANVHPGVPHPRWSQETEELLSSGERVATEIFNGYGDQVAHLYPGTHEPTYFR
jgi:methionine sulfoxide reductase catalytic subunit